MDKKWTIEEIKERLDNEDDSLTKDLLSMVLQLMMREHITTKILGLAQLFPEGYLESQHHYYSEWENFKELYHEK